MNLTEEQIFTLTGLLDRLFSEDFYESKIMAGTLPTDLLEELWSLRTDLHDSLTFTQSP